MTDNKIIKVLHVVWSVDVGGIREVVLNLCTQQLRNPSLKIGLVIGKKTEDPLHQVMAGNLDVFYAGLKNGRTYNASKLDYLKELMSGYDIIHFHTYNPLIAEAAIRSKKKIVYTVHGNFGFYRKKALPEYLIFFLQRRFLNKRVSYITFNSNFTASVAQKRFGLRKIQKHIIYNGIPVTELKEEPQVSRVKCSLPATPFITGAVCRFVEFKRLDRLITCFARFAENKDTLLVLVGDGPLRHELEKQCEHLDITNKVIFTGFKKKVTEYQNAFDLCVMPSSKEPFGLVAVEFLAQKKPVLVYKDGGGLTEIISGISQQDVVEDDETMTGRMNFYFNNLGHEPAENKEARLHHALKFDIKKMEESFFNLYMQAIE